MAVIEKWVSLQPFFTHDDFDLEYVGNLAQQILRFTASKWLFKTK